MSHSDSHPFRPDYVIPPGETLRDQLAEMNLSQAELAVRAGLSTKHVNQIIKGSAPITPETAIVLERITGIPASVWNRREADYREGCCAPSRAFSAPRTKGGCRHFRSRNCRRGAGSQTNATAAGCSRRCCRSSASPIAKPGNGSGAGRSRRSGAPRRMPVSPAAVVSWLRIAQIEAQQAKVQPYSAQRFRKALQEIRSLTAHGDANRIIEICAAAGVVVVFVREVTGCRISGAAWWATPSRAVVALSDRYKKDDYFWFAFFHEAAHVLLHSKKETFVDDGSDNDVVEDEANKFAADLLIPPDRAPELSRLVTDSDVEAFASEIGIAPGIVVGRLQHDGLWGWNRGHKLKRRLQIIED